MLIIPGLGAEKSGAKDHCGYICHDPDNVEEPWDITSDRERAHTFSDEHEYSKAIDFLQAQGEDVILERIEGG
ncbi:MAG TPA: hypothetical protein VKP88_04870 [Candidatus Paceibacterota bacterium]|nr:hypothetical protein [Candidatus Paceibacterota bacterium]